MASYDAFLDECEQIGWRLNIPNPGDLTPFELMKLWDGYVWRRRLDMDALAMTTTYIASGLGAKVEYTNIRASLGFAHPEDLGLRESGD